MYGVEKCCEGGTNVLVYACSGGANVGEIADASARKLMKENCATMFCLAGLGAQIEGMVQTAKDAELNLLIDGCPMDCTKKVFDKLAITNYHQLRVTDLGIEKTKGVEITEEQVTKTVQKAKQLVAQAQGGITVKKIHVLGTGCPKCRKLEQNLAEAVRELGIECQIEKVTDIDEILKYGVMITPALLVDGKVKVAGKVPTKEELESIIFE